MNLRVAVRSLVAACAAAATVVALAPSAAHAAPEPTYCNIERPQFEDETIQGDLVVAADPTFDFSHCELTNTTVKGNVVVGEGMNLKVQGGTVRGDVIANNEASVAIFNSKISGSFRQTGVLRGTLIDTSEVGGSVEHTSTSDEGGLAIRKSQIQGDVRASVAENSGTETVNRGYDLSNSSIGGDLNIDGLNSPYYFARLFDSQVNGDTILRRLNDVEAGLSEPASAGAYAGNEFAGDVTIDDNNSVKFHHNQIKGTLRGSGNDKVEFGGNQADKGAKGQFREASTEPATECSGSLNDTTIKGDVEVRGESKCSLDNVEVLGELRVLGEDASAEVLNSSRVDGDVLVEGGELSANDFEIAGRLTMVGTENMRDRSLKDLRLARGSIGGGFDIGGSYSIISMDTLSLGAASEISGGVLGPPVDEDSGRALANSIFAARQITSQSLLTIDHAIARVSIEDSSLMGGLRNVSASGFRLMKTRVSALEVSNLDDGWYNETFPDWAIVGGEDEGNEILGNVLISSNDGGQIQVTHNVISGSLGGEGNSGYPPAKVENNEIRGGTWGDFA